MTMKEAIQKALYGYILSNGETEQDVDTKLEAARRCLSALNNVAEPDKTWIGENCAVLDRAIPIELDRLNRCLREWTEDDGDLSEVREEKALLHRALRASVLRRNGIELPR